MHKLSAVLGVLAATPGIVVPGVAPSASAAIVVTNVVTSVSADLSVSVQPTADWGSKGSSGITEVSGRLGSTMVTDNRGGTVGWSARAATTAFSNGTTSSTGVTYDSGPVTFTGAVTPVSRGTTSLSATPVEVVAGTAVGGTNTASWDPTLTVTLPSSSTTGDYTGTVSTSLL